MPIEVILKNNFSIIDLLTAIAALSGAMVAIYGVVQWKRQLKGKTDYEVARRYLKASLKLRDAIQSVRNPFVPLAEINSSLKEAGLDPEIDDNRKTNLAVYNVRWKKVIGAWTDLELELLEAEVSWGKGAVDAQKPLDGCVRKLKASIDMHLQRYSKRGEEELIYNSGPDDSFSIEVNNAIDGIKSYLKPHLT